MKYFYTYLILHSGYMCIHRTLVQTFLLLIAKKKKKKKTLGDLMYKFIILFFLFFFLGWHKWNKFHCKQRNPKEILFFVIFIMQTFKNFVTAKERWISLDSKTWMYDMFQTPEGWCSLLSTMLASAHTHFGV